MRTPQRLGIAALLVAVLFGPACRPREAGLEERLAEAAEMVRGDIDHRAAKRYEQLETELAELARRQPERFIRISKGSGNRYGRIGALDAMGSAGDARFLPALVQALNDADLDVRQAALINLRPFTRKALPGTQSALVRQALARFLDPGPAGDGALARRMLVALGPLTPDEEDALTLSLLVGGDQQELAGEGKQYRASGVDLGRAADRILQRMRGRAEALRSSKGPGGS